MPTGWKSEREENRWMLISPPCLQQQSVLSHADKREAVQFVEAKLSGKMQGEKADGKFSSLSLLILYGKWKSVIELLIEHETTGSLRGCLYANRSAGLCRTPSVQHICCLKYSAHTLPALWLLMGNTFTGRSSFLSNHKNTKRIWHHSIMGVNSQM